VRLRTMSREDFSRDRCVALHLHRGCGMVDPAPASAGLRHRGVDMDSSEQPAKAERFLPDWIVGGVIRASLIPSLWHWGRVNADVWPGVMPDTIAAAAIWNIPLLSAGQSAQIAVWGAQLVAAMLLVGFLTRLVGLVLLLACAVHVFWILPEAWSSAAVFAAASFYLFARGGGALSIDGAIIATLR